MVAISKRHNVILLKYSFNLSIEACDLATEPTYRSFQLTLAWNAEKGMSKRWQEKVVIFLAQVCLMHILKVKAHTCNLIKPTAMGSVAWLTSPSYVTAQALNHR